jgi:hypothetical protein
LDYLASKLKQLSLNASLGLVAGSYISWARNPVHSVAVQELMEGGGRFCIKVQGESGLPAELQLRQRIEPGTLVALCKNGHVNSLCTTDGSEFRCIEPDLSPEELGIPAEWNGSGPLMI